jgi:hypothetical protein
MVRVRELLSWGPLYGRARHRPPRSRAFDDHHTPRSFVGLERRHIRRDFHRPVNHHNSEARGSRLHRALGDRPDDRCARRRSLWMARGPGAAHRLAADAWRRIANWRRSSDPTLIGTRSTRGDQTVIGR